MFNKVNRLGSKRKKCELKVSIGENVRDSIIRAGLKSVEESAYIAGNNTEKIAQFAGQAGTALDRASEFGLGGESARAAAIIAFKTTKDAARGDKTCTSLCIISAACETVALCCSTVKIIPFRGRIYVGSKILSKGCMTFRNLCASDGC